jgi:Putative adhesin
MHAFETPEAPRLRVRNPAGMITIEAGEGNRTTVELEPLRDDDATREAIERATVEAYGNDVTVEVGELKGFGIGAISIAFGRTPQVGIRIRCPEGAELDCTTASANLKASGRLGDVEAKSASGDVSVDAVTALRVQSASGDVRAAVVDGEARIQTVSGDVRLGPVMGAITATLVSGDFQADEGQSDVAVKTVSGDQRVDAVRQGQIKLQSVSGDVRLGVRPGTRLQIDASSTSGDISSEFDVTDRPSEQPSGLEARLQVKTVSGDVDIVRAAPVSA